MTNTTFAQTARSSTRPIGLPFDGQPGPDGAFWSGAIGAGSAIMGELFMHVEVLSHSIVQLPHSAAAARPAVASYLNMVKSIALAWSSDTRAPLLEAIEGLSHVGASLAQPHALAALASRREDGGKAALRVIDGAVRRLAIPAVGLELLQESVDARLASMASATAELQADTLLVSQRLQSDQVHAFLLSQHASALQSKLDDATVRQDAYWLQGPHCEQIRQEIAMHTSALEGVRRQLDHLHAEQAATRCEAHYLQKLMPSLAAYLGALERLAGAMRATAAGMGAMLAELHALKHLLATEPEHAGDLAAQLRAALPQWRGVASGAARVRRVAPMMPDGRRT